MYLYAMYVQPVVFLFAVQPTRGHIPTDKIVRLQFHNKMHRGKINLSSRNEGCYANRNRSAPASFSLSAVASSNTSGNAY
jgi:hypothetical protein